jgi:hypothetical protein
VFLRLRRASKSKADDCALGGSRRGCFRIAGERGSGRRRRSNVVDSGTKQLSSFLGVGETSGVVLMGFHSGLDRMLGGCLKPPGIYRKTTDFGH